MVVNNDKAIKWQTQERYREMEKERREENNKREKDRRHSNGKIRRQSNGRPERKRGRGEREIRGIMEVNNDKAFKWQTQERYREIEKKREEGKNKRGKGTRHSNGRPEFNFNIIL